MIIYFPRPPPRADLHVLAIMAKQNRFIDVGKALADISQHLDGWALPYGVWEPTYERVALLSNMQVGMSSSSQLSI